MNTKIKALIFVITVVLTLGSLHLLVGKHHGNRMMWSHGCGMHASPACGENVDCHAKTACPYTKADEAPKAHCCQSNKTDSIKQ